MPRKAKPIKDRLLSKVEKLDNGCWFFTGAKLSSGYGKISVTRSKPGFAHRVSYEVFNGQIPDGYVVMHTCDNPSCVNPEHLVAGTQKQNWLDARGKCRNYVSPQQTPNYVYVNHYLKKKEFNHASR